MNFVSGMTFFTLHIGLRRAIEIIMFLNNEDKTDTVSVTIEDYVFKTTCVR